MPFLLNKFCSRPAVYLGNYVILSLFSPSGPFHLALWADGLVISLTHSGGKLLCQTHFRHSTGSVLPLWLFLITFSPCHSLTLSSHSLCTTHPLPPHPSPPLSATRTRAAKRRLTAADDFHDAPFSQLFMTHTRSLSLSLSLAQMRNSHYVEKNLLHIQ